MVKHQSTFLYVGVACALLVLTYVTGSVHDYIAYVRQWQNILSGADPWAAAQDSLGEIPENAYGPVHVLFAGLVLLHPLLPKFAIAFFTLAVFGLVFALTTTRDACRAAASKLFWLYTLSPLVIISVFVFGINDGMVGGLILLACLFRTRGAHGWVGAVLGLAALLKFYPLLFTPFFAVSQDGVLKLRTLFSAAATFALGMGLAWLYWGSSVFDPVLFGDERGPKLLSILKFLNEIKHDLSIQRYVGVLLEVNSLAVVCAAALVAVWGWLTRQGWEVTSLLGILAIFLTYKVGHPQFYVSWIALYAWILATSSDERAVLVARAFTPLSAFLGLFQVLYYGSYLITGAYFPNQLQSFRVYGSVALLAVVFWCLRRAFPHLGRVAGPSVSVRL